MNRQNEREREKKFARKREREKGKQGCILNPGINFYNLMILGKSTKICWRKFD
jgi:hypothetical protein